jgi:hypothetical protein
MKKVAVTLLGGAAFLAPLSVFAQDVGYLTGFIGQVQDIVNSLPPIIIGLAVVFFLWGIVQFVMAGDDEGARAKGKSHMLWGIIAILVMVSLWGIIALLQTVFNIGGGAAPDLNPLD